MNDCYLNSSENESIDRKLAQTLRTNIDAC